MRQSERTGHSEGPGPVAWVFSLEHVERRRRVERALQARAAQNGVPDIAAHLAYCEAAEACGIESLLTAFGFHRPDPIALAAALGVLTSKVKFMVASALRGHFAHVVRAAGQHGFRADPGAHLPECGRRPHAQRTTRAWRFPEP